MSISTSSSRQGVPPRRSSTGDIPTPITGLTQHIPLYRCSDSCADGRDRALSLDSAAANGQGLPPLTVSSTIAPVPRSPGSSPELTWSAPLVAEDAGEERPEETLSVTGANGTAQRRRHQSLYVKTAAFLGYGRDSTKTRKELISFISSLSWAFTQMTKIVVILTVVGLSANFKSPTSPGLTEWQACDKPLGVWSSIWVVRVFYSWGLGYWNWVRNRQARIRADVESPSARNGNGASASSVPPPRHLASNTNMGTTSPASANSPEVPHSMWYARLTLLSSLMTVSWFLTAHILIYTSLNTCRHSSPHLWWLTFSILCIMYVMVLEIVVLLVVVFIIAPILFLLWNIILICLGRHPLQHPTAIKPEIGKLPKSAVDRIPLVMYIPPPPDEAAKEAIRVPEAAYTYPPTTPTLPAQKRRFKWWKRGLSSLKGKNGKNGEAGGEKGGRNVNEKATNGEEVLEVVLWEEHWEQGEYPFVRLEGNRAACAICLMDFEEPKRIRGITAEEETGNVDTIGEDEAIKQLVREVPVEEVGETPELLKLSDAGDGAQPLRLLACGHVFHKTCLDPWLEKVSGRCPVCQRPVELPQPGQKSARGRRRWQRR